MHRADRVRLYRLFLRYQSDLRELAATSFSGVRDYNTELQARHVAPYDRSSMYGINEFWYGVPAHVEYRASAGASYLAQRDDTFEFRIWNATVGVSVAMVNAACDKVNVTPETQASFEETMADYFDVHTWAGIIRQRHSRGIAA